MRWKGNLGADAALVLVTLVWGSTFVTAKDILERWPPLSYLALRLGLAALVLVALFPKQLKRAGREEWRAGATLGLLFAAGFSGQAFGLVFTSPSKSAFVTGLTTPLVPVVAFLLLYARPSRENMIGIVLASIGGALILAPQGDGAVNLGDLITLCCTAVFAAHLIYMSVYARRYDLRQLTVLQITVAAAFTLLLWLGLHFYARVWGDATGEGVSELIARQTQPLVWSARVVGQLVYLALVATVFNFLLWTWAQARMPATHAAIIFSLEPVFATLFAVLLRGSGEWAGGTRATLGAVLILAGVIVSELRLSVRDEEEEIVEEAAESGTL
jgi:drug/metabolite transporter (DMT)-like permease